MTVVVAGIQKYSAAHNPENMSLGRAFCLKDRPQYPIGCVLKRATDDAPKGLFPQLDLQRRLARCVPHRTAKLIEHSPSQEKGQPAIPTHNERLPKGSDDGREEVGNALIRRKPLPEPAEAPSRQPNALREISYPLMAADVHQPFSKGVRNYGHVRD
jgi:hypothetical protein